MATVGAVVTYFWLPRKCNMPITAVLVMLCTYHCHAPPTPGRAEIGISGDLQELFDKFPTPGDDFMLQIPYYSPGMRWG